MMRSGICSPFASQMGLGCGELTWGRLNGLASRRRMGVTPWMTPPPDSPSLVSPRKDVSMGAPMASLRHSW
jgi:hypothetical protein